MYVRVMAGGDLQDAMTALRAAFDEVAGCEVDLLTRPDLVAALDELETLSCRLPAVGYRLLARLQVEATPQQMGAKSWKEVLTVRWRISTGEAHRRLAEAAVLAPRPSVTGPTLPPVLPATAVAQEHGLINAEHVDVIRRSLTKVPGWVDTATREQFELDLVRTAVGNGPKELKDSADRALFLLDQDGPEPDDTERARKRAVTRSKQRPDGMTDLSVTLTPEAWAVWEAIFAKFAAPGMCNPDDPEPCTSGTPSQAQIDNDQRSLAQRQHDAMVAAGRIALMSGDLGQLNGLPVSVIIRTTLQDLESRAGVGTTGGGTVMPIAEVIRMAGHANHYLAVFDRATGSALDLFRARRTATAAQRIMLIARDGGCTKPCCTVGAYGSQVHHVVADWAKGGNTNVDELGLACGPDNRSVDDNGGWTTRMNDRCEVEWIPPPHLDTGQTRTNNYHRPERLLRPPDDPEPEISVSAEPTAGGNVGDAESDVVRPADDPGEPGGPAPPEGRAA
ncbi:HNH endonuclease signature motif containing protein [Mycobacterium sp. ITM-2016-00317]|uniref:HNH endonuclease signature motif containing protein n=2 Tax=Mycobacteriaceae TaxID=1762 RepID=UPI00287FC8EF|nr:HNH endonuclease signature motif containing protein [Mycobacterium sp. ITM-2016-00317]WNG89141.1 HNH endonuclease signature motif containing protein [Mycobacterium sp. ITM-2016-00317]